MILSKDSSVHNQRLKVQSLSIPFVITGNVTAASVSISSDVPEVMKVQTSGVDQISPALTAAGDSVTFNTAVSDAGGTFRVLLQLGEKAQKLVGCRVEILDLSKTCTVKAGDADGLSALGSIALVCDSNADFSAPENLSATLHVQYIGE